MSNNFYRNRRSYNDNNNRNFAKNKGKKGYVYILENRPNDFVYKIGHTTRRVNVRVSEINSNHGGFYAYKPANYFCIHKKETIDCYTAEQLIHKELDSFRVMRGFELFEFKNNDDLEFAKFVIHEICTQINSEFDESVIAVKPDLESKSVTSPPHTELPLHKTVNEILVKEKNIDSAIQKNKIDSSTNKKLLTTIKNTVKIIFRILNVSIIALIITFLFMYFSNSNYIAISENGRIFKESDEVRAYIQGEKFWRRQSSIVDEEIRFEESEIKDVYDSYNRKMEMDYCEQNPDNSYYDEDEDDCYSQSEIESGKNSKKKKEVNDLLNKVFHLENDITFDVQKEKHNKEISKLKNIQEIIMDKINKS